MHQASLKKFAPGMTGGSRLAAQSIAAIFAWGNVGTFVDVGTAEGCLPVEIARATLICKGVGFDLPQVHPVFDQDICQHGLQHRLKFRPGNFLSDALPKADVLGRMLSRSISELERTLGVRLLERTRHGIELTECECAILSRSHAAFDELRQGVKDVALRPTSRALSRPLSTGSTSTIRA